jgi:hypothetical protein
VLLSLDRFSSVGADQIAGLQGVGTGCLIFKIAVCAMLRLDAEHRIARN